MVAKSYSWSWVCLLITFNFLMPMQYFTTDLPADILFPLVWDVDRHLETVGLKVITLTDDEGSCNLSLQNSRNSWKLHI